MACAVAVGIMDEAAGQTAGGGVRVTIRIDQDGAALIAAWRRAKGLDPPDARADAEAAEIRARLSMGFRAKGVGASALPQ